MTRPRPLAALALLAAALAWLLLAGAHADDPPVRLFVLPSEGPVVAHLVLPNCPHGTCPGPTALMHYTEHLAWLSAVGREARAPDRHSNAWTNAFAVGYRVSGAAGDLPDILATLFRVLDPIDLPPGFAEEEREIVLREYELVIGSSLSARVGEAMAAFLYAGNPIAASVIGTPDEIRGFTPDAARALHAATHRPEHATLFVTGDVSERAVRRALARIALPPAQGPVAPLAPPPFALGPSETRLLAFPDPNAAARLVLRRVVALDEAIPFERLAAHAALLATILDTRLDGGLAGPLRLHARIARSFQIGIGAIDERHVEIRFVAEPDRGTTLAALARAFEEILVEIARAGIPDETFSRVRARFSRTFPDWDDPPAAARAMADRALARLAILRPPLDEAQMRALEAGLSRDTLDTLLAALAGEGRTAIAFVGQEEVFE